MSRLKSVKPGPAMLGPGVGPADRGEAQRARDAIRSKRQAARLYQSRRWRELRLQVLERDGWVCQATGVYLTSGRKAPNSAVVDHITPHRLDLDLFFDPDNCRAVSKEWHDSQKQRAEKADQKAARQPGGWVRF